MKILDDEKQEREEWGKVSRVYRVVTLHQVPC